MTTGPHDVGSIFLVEARRQLDGCAEKIRHCADQLDEIGIWWRPGEGRNSVGNLLLHLAGNLAQRFGHVLGGDPDIRDRDAEFAERGPIAKDELLRRFDAAVGRARTALDGLTPAQVAEPRPYRTSAGVVDATALAVVVRTLLHLAAHTQEIIAMTRTRLGPSYRTYGRGDW
jgi:hypothetical protein